MILLSGCFPPVPQWSPQIIPVLSNSLKQGLSLGEKTVHKLCDFSFSLDVDASLVIPNFKGNKLVHECA